MDRKLATIALVVADYDPAIAWFTQKLGFRVAEDTGLGHGKRWVVLSAGTGGAQLLLAKAANASQARTIGNQTGGRVFLFLETDDFNRDHAAFLSRGVRFLEEPRQEPYGTVAVFEDLYGNKWDLLQRRK